MYRDTVAAFIRRKRAPNTEPQPRLRQVQASLRLLELASVLVPVDHVASFIVNADRGIVRVVKPILLKRSVDGKWKFGLDSVV
jgi:hypothetical protein